MKIVAGAVLPGRPLANLYFSAWSHSVISQSLNMASDLKMGEYREYGCVLSQKHTDDITSQNPSSNHVPHPNLRYHHRALHQLCGINLDHSFASGAPPHDKWLLRLVRCFLPRSEHPGHVLGALERPLQERYRLLYRSYRTGHRCRGGPPPCWTYPIHPPSWQVRAQEHQHSPRLGVLGISCSHITTDLHDSHRSTCTNIRSMVSPTISTQDLQRVQLPRHCCFRWWQSVRHVHLVLRGLWCCGQRSWSSLPELVWQQATWIPRSLPESHRIVDIDLLQPGDAFLAI